MAYTRYTWTKGDVITADRLNNMEAGIAANATDLAALLQRVVALEKSGGGTGGGSVQTLSNLASPTISGSTALGGVLTVTNGIWNVTPDTYGYQWRRNGTAISGATANTYTLTTTDASAVLSVLVVANKANYTSGSAVSNSVTADAPGTTTPTLVVVDNGNGTFSHSGTSVVDNNNGTYTVNDTGITDNGNGTYTATADTSAAPTVLTVADNGNGTYTLNGSAITDNGNGTFTGSNDGITDNNNGTFAAAA